MRFQERISKSRGALDDLCPLALNFNETISTEPVGRRDGAQRLADPAEPVPLSEPRIRRMACFARVIPPSQLVDLVQPDRSAMEHSDNQRAVAIERNNREKHDTHGTFMA